MVKTTMKYKRGCGWTVFLAMMLCLPTIVLARMGMGTQPFPFFAAPATVGGTPFYYYDHPASCFGHGRMGMMCHGDKFQQWQSDQHARAWTGDFMVAQY